MAWLSAYYPSQIKQTQESPHDQVRVMIRKATNAEKSEQSSGWLSYIVYYGPLQIANKICDSAQLIWSSNLKQSFAQHIHENPWIGRFNIFLKPWYLAINSHVLKEIFKSARNDPEGYFKAGRSVLTLLAAMRQVFPEEKDLSADDFLLTCQKAHVGKYRTALIKLLNLQNVWNHSPELQEIIKETVKNWSGKGVFSLTEQANIFACSVISKMLLGYPGPYDKIADAVGFINEYIIIDAFGWCIPKATKDAYQEKIRTIHETVQGVLDNPQDAPLGNLVKSLREEAFTDAQIKIMIVSLFTAGQETTGALLTHTIWQLAKHPGWQEKIYEEIQAESQKTDYKHDVHHLSANSKSLHQFFMESIRIFTPAYSLPRDAATDLVCEVIDEESNKIVHSQYIPKSYGFNPCPTFAARDQKEFGPDANNFYPHRHREVNGLFPKMSWLPFGDGYHACPGQSLAKQEIKQFITWLVWNYRIETEQQGEIQDVGFLTLKLKEDIKIEILPRV